MKFVNYLIYLLLFLLPLQTRLILRPGNGWEYKIIGLFATELLLWVVVVLVMFLKHRQKKEFPISNFQFPIIVLFILLLITWIAAPDKSIAIQQIIHVLEAGILFWLLVGSQINRLTAAYVFLGGLSLQAVLAIYQFLNQSSFASRLLGLTAHNSAVAGASVIENLGGRWLRAYGGLPHPNILAGYLVLGIVLIALVLQCFSVGRRGRLILLTDSALLATALFFTFSRAAWLALLAALVIFLISEKRRLGKINNDLQIFTSSLALIFIILSLIFAPLLITRVTAQDRLEKVSTSERIAGYKEAADLFVKHPFFGVGAGNYTAVVYKELDSSRQSWAYQPLHNSWVLMLVELGLVGVLIILLALLYIFKYSLFDVPYALVVLFIVIGLFDHYLWSLYSGLMLIAVGAGLTPHMEILGSVQSLSRDKIPPDSLENKNFHVRG